MALPRRTRWLLLRFDVAGGSERGLLKDELEAFDAMVRADSGAIHELYLLNGKLIRRYVPPGVVFP